MKSWSNIVLIFSACGMVTPAPPINPFTNYPYFLESPGLLPSGPSYVSYAYLPNPSYPGRVAMATPAVNSDTSSAHSGFRGGINNLSAGLANVGAGLSSGVAAAVSALVTAVATVISGIFGDGFVNDATPSFNNQKP